LSTAPLVLFVVTAFVLPGVALRTAARHPRASAATERKTLRNALLGWIALHGAFTYWWEASNFEFWLMLLPAVIVLMALGPERVWVLSPRVRWLLVTLATTLGTGNLFSRVYPDSKLSNNPVMQVLDRLHDAGARGGELVLAQYAELTPYSSYFW